MDHLAKNLLPSVASLCDMARKPCCNYSRYPCQARKLFREQTVVNNYILSPEPSDMPGHATSHGCLGLYDEEMQKEYYGYPKESVLNSSRRLYEWVIGSGRDDGEFTTLHDGPRVLIVGEAP